MSIRHSRIALAIASFFLTAGLAVAQDSGLAVPDAAYASSVDAFRSPTDLGIPPPDDGSNPNVVTIPIPGGGAVTVDGPDAPDEKPIPTLPGSQWGAQQQNPFSHGTGALGP